MRVAAIVAAGLALLTASAVAGVVSMTFPHWVWMLVLSAVACGLLVASAAWLWRRTPVPSWWMPLLIIIGIAARLLLMQSQHLLSDDAARYHWDGKVLAHGINPYHHPPDSPALENLRTDALDVRVNHADLVTVYPPLAQLLFVAAYRLSPGSLVGFQGLCLIAELLTWLLLAWYLRRSGRSPVWLVLIIWSPLLICEGYAPGHSDLLGLPLLALFLVATLRRWPVRAGLALAGACLIKPLALVLAPAALRELGPRDSRRFATAAVLAAAALNAPFIGAGRSLLSSTQLMAQEWQFNATIAAAVEAALPTYAARVVLGLLLASAVLAAACWGRDLLGRSLLAMAALVALSPVLFPWYLVWLLPLLVLRPDPALLALCLLAPLSELVMIPYAATGTWHEPLWVRLVIFTPFYGLLVAGVRYRWGMFARPGEVT